MGLDKDFIEAKDIRNIYIANQILEKYKFPINLGEKEKHAIIYSILNNFSLNKKPFLVSLVTDMENLGLNIQEIYGMIVNMSVSGKVSEELSYSCTNILSNQNEARRTIGQYKDKIQTSVTKATILEAMANNIDESDIKSKLINLGIDKEIISVVPAKNLYIAEKILEGYNFNRDINFEEKKAILSAILNNKLMKKSNALISLIKYMERVNLNQQEIYGMIINLGINNKVIGKAGYNYSSLLMNSKNCCQTIKQYKGEIQTNVTEETIQKALKKINKGKKIKSKNIAQSTMELTVEGRGGSQICDDVQADYQRLMLERTKENKKEGSEQDVSN